MSCVAQSDLTWNWSHMNEVSGKVLLDSWRGERGPSTVYLRIQDTSRIDAPARTVVEDVLQNVQLDELRGAGMEFRMTVDEVDPTARYEVRVLVDLDHDGRLSAGDYTNTVAYPVLTRGHSDRVEVHVRPIG